MSADHPFEFQQWFEGAAQVWDWSSSKPLRSLGEEASYVHSVVFSPDSSLIATSDIGGRIVLWSASSGKSVRKFDGGYSSNDALAFSPDETRLASGGNNQNIIVGGEDWCTSLAHLTVRERYRPSATEIAEQKQAAALAAAKEKERELRFAERNLVK